MRILVTGSRDFPHEKRWAVSAIILGINSHIGDDPDFVIIEGECPFGGVDRYARETAEAFGWTVEPYPPKGRTAVEYHSRNRAMVDEGKPDLCVAITHKPLELSRGTLYTYSYAKEKGVESWWLQV